MLKVRFAAGSAVAGTGILIALFLVQDFPSLGLWALFAAAFVFFEFRAVEVHDHLLVSPSVMVALTAAVVFGSGSATLGVAAMAALGLLTPLDIRERRMFQPLVNYGNLVVSATASVLVIEWLLPTPITVGNLWRVALAAAAGAIVHGVVNFTVVGWIVGSVYRRGKLRPWTDFSVNHVSYFAMGFLGGLLGATYLLVGPVTLPLILSAYIVGHMAFFSYAQLHEAQEATLRGFVKALEAKDRYTRGHTERVAYFAEMIGTELHYSPARLQTLRWAALIHDVGKLAVPRDLISKRTRLTEGEHAQMRRHVHLVEDLLAEVEFLRPIVHIAAAHHIHFDGSGYGGTHHRAGDPPCEESCVLSVADAFDAMTSTRSYRMALSQEYALAELRRNAGRQFDPIAVEALASALAATGERYGSDGLDDDEEARRIAASMSQVAHG